MIKSSFSNNIQQSSSVEGYLSGFPPVGRNIDPYTSDTSHRRLTLIMS